MASASQIVHIWFIHKEHNDSSQFVNLEHASKHEMATGLNKLVDSMKREIQALRAENRHSKRSAQLVDNPQFRRNNSTQFVKTRQTATTKTTSFPAKENLSAQNKTGNFRQGLTTLNLQAEPMTQSNEHVLIYEDEALRVKEAIRLAREMLHGLAPKDTYFRLKDLPEKDVTLPEYVLIKTHELVTPLHQENQQLLLENASLKEDLKFKNEKLKIMAHEIENSDRLLNDKASSHQRIIDGLENERQLLLNQLNKSREETNDLRDKLVKEEEINRENRLLKEEVMILKHKLALIDPNPNYTRSAIEEERSSLYKKIDQLQKANTDLTLDNTRKQGELAKALEKIAAVEEECKRLQVKNERYIEDLIKIQRSVSEGFEKRLSIELESIRNRHTLELESSRSNMKHMYETQISFLKEQKDDIEREMLSANARLKEKETSWLQVCQENSELTKKYEGDLAQTKAELSLKSQELATRQADLDISRQTEASLRVENDALKEKITLLRTEIYKNEAKFSEEIGVVKAENIALKRELHNYDLIEKEVDNCILEQANIDKDSNDEDVRLLLSAPTSKNKRILQALSLGQKLSAKERENVDLRKQLYDADLRIKNLKNELESVKRVAEITKNPGNYLVRVIEEKESEILNLQRKMATLENENTETKTQLETMKTRYRELSAKMGVLETKKSDIKKIQDILLATAEFKAQSKAIEPKLEHVNQMLESTPWIPVREDLENLQSTKKPNWYYQLKSKSSK